MERLIDHDGTVDYIATFLDADEARRLFVRLRREIAWEAVSVRMFGREVEVPRRVAWYGDAGARYRYSGITHEPLPWPEVLKGPRVAVEEASGRSFNAVLANLYRDGGDAIGWHADNEPELGPEPFIASLSLGQARRFRLWHVASGRKVDLVLEPGSLLLMGGPLQRHWRHCLPRTRRPVGARINLTFRQVAIQS